MSVVRWSENSDLYIYYSDQGIACCGCGANGNHTIYCETEAEMIDHIREHIAAGDKVPAHVIPALMEPEED